jgi:NAD(P)-dependent dehydrogenase (short-subunit alcohol dehydrogenase family)
MPTMLITGSARNLGLAFVRHFTGRGWRVIATCRDSSTAGQLRGLAATSAGRITIHDMDIAAPETIRRVADEFRGTPIDVLVNNAGFAGRAAIGSTFGATDYSDWLKVFQVNAIGPMMVSEAFAENVAASERRIIFTISSRIGPKPAYGAVAYRAAKSALNQVVKQLALGLAPRQVIAVAVHPGWVQNDNTVGKAALTPDESVAMLAGLIDRLTIADSGKFFDPDGSELPLITQQTAPKPYAMSHERW